MEESTFKCAKCPDVFNEDELKLFRRTDGKLTIRAFCRRCFTTNNFNASPDLYELLKERGRPEHREGIPLMERFRRRFGRASSVSDSGEKRPGLLGRKGSSKEMERYVDQTVKELSTHSRLCALLEREELG